MIQVINKTFLLYYHQKQICYVWMNTHKIYEQHRFPVLQKFSTHALKILECVCVIFIKFIMYKLINKCIMISYIQLENKLLWIIYFESSYIFSLICQHLSKNYAELVLWIYHNHQYVMCLWILNRLFPNITLEWSQIYK